MSEATVILTLANRRTGSNQEQVFLDILGPGMNIEPQNVTNKMGRTVFYRVPADQPHSYRLRVERGPRLPAQVYAPTPLFEIPGPQQRLPITQFVKDAICSAVN